MSIALSTIVLFFLLIPGILFRRFYYSEEFSREYFKSTFFEVFISTIIPSLVFQLMWFFIARLTNFHVDLNILSNLVSTSPLEATFRNVQDNSINILIYNITLFLFAGFSGYLSKQIIRNKKWDRTYKVFRYQNSWHYILKGEFLDFPRAQITLEKDSVEDIELIFVDTVLELGGVPYLYDGILVDYELASDGGLETISIKNAQRRKLSSDRAIDEEGTNSNNLDQYYPIDGHILLIKYSEMKNLNFSYLKLEQTGEELTPKLVE